jgi:N-acetylmuramoyl-L-alanine amidase
MNPILIPSSHKRQRKELPDTIVIHAMGEFVEGRFASDFLEDRGLSAHYLIMPDGRVINTVLPSQVAYHAKSYNNRSVGIEMLIAGNHTYTSFLAALKSAPTFTYAQISTCDGLVGFLKNELPIKKIVAHSEIDPTKFDPGPNFLMEEIR